MRPWIEDVGERMCMDLRGHAGSLLSRVFAAVTSRVWPMLDLFLDV